FTLTSSGVSTPAITNGGNEVQTLTFSGTSGGTATPSYSGVAASGPNATLTFTPGASPTAAQVLASLSSIPALSGNVNVTGAAGGPFTVTFANGAANRDVNQLTASVAGGAAVSVATTLNGGPATASQIQAALNAIPAL